MVFVPSKVDDRRPEGSGSLSPLWQWLSSDSGHAGIPPGFTAVADFDPRLCRQCPGSNTPIIGSALVGLIRAWEFERARIRKLFIPVCASWDNHEPRIRADSEACAIRSRTGEQGARHDGMPEEGAAGAPSSSWIPARDALYCSRCPSRGCLPGFR